MARIHFASGTKWEPLVGYSRAVRVGKWISVSGTTATDRKGTIRHLNDIYGQTRLCLENIVKALNHVDANAENVIRTRIYVRNIDQWTDVARAHCEFFGEIKPATSMIEINRFISEEILVEIEADAIVDEA